MATCQIETAHCQDCGSTWVTTDQWGPVCEDCEGRVVNADQCDGSHL